MCIRDRSVGGQVDLWLQIESEFTGLQSLVHMADNIVFLCFLSVQLGVIKAYIVAVRPSCACKSEQGMCYEAVGIIVFL